MSMRSMLKKGLLLLSILSIVPVATVSAKAKHHKTGMKKGHHKMKGPASAPKM